MSPIAAGGKDSHAARIVGSGTAGIAELMLFHPVDTIAKRLMSNKTVGLPVNEIVFKQHATAPAGAKFLSLFPGLGYAAGYKVLQRVYKFGGQPYFNDYLNTNHRAFFTNAFGEKNGKAIMSATAGSLTGIGEIVLLPLDVLKIKRQTNPEAFRSRGFLRIVKDEGFALYRGASWTAARNAPGSFALFGGSAFTKEYVFGLQDYRTATWYQNFVASIAGSVSSIAISQPLDVIKTRIQNQNFENKVGGMTIVRELIKNEGFSAFFKGLTPKVLVVGPKLVFSYTLAQTLIPIFSKYI
ncbi:mitochondrial GTP/GDP carrier protein 1 [Microbotryum lychnidis-dioicae p1A1 Lamole]|uniref:Mitochondrial GTP/GDP carrier protein 1 n=1 Tax=Microbotryum lychnidis-dioicae (strain p1A1 Lamole / MvSl-1064) TaxID=683840 RepID=U5HFL3_USTV1|nr:mitochondrial GTP/GDP carrier protein 1 [Microbotryum lychnidis-dioicae p1A1 Lamole]|eukprot:KDE03639.1 mitochondrial GTP/GDP carrier protein 1 [Microbotryum lychnidis-dioicae p1A1 Lamole]